MPLLRCALLIVDETSGLSTASGMSQTLNTSSTCLVPTPIHLMLLSKVHAALLTRFRSQSAAFLCGFVRRVVGKGRSGLISATVPPDRVFNFSRCEGITMISLLFSLVFHLLGCRADASCKVC